MTLLGAGIEVVRYAPELKEPWDIHVRRAKNRNFLFLRDYMDYHQDRFADHSLIFLARGRALACLPANETPAGLHSHQGLTFGGLVMHRDIRLDDVSAIFRALRRYLAANDLRELVYGPMPWPYHELPAEEDLLALNEAGATAIKLRVAAMLRVGGPSSFSTNRRRDLLLGSAESESTIGPADTPPGESGPDIYLASRLYETGGHTAVIGDYMRCADARPALLALTNMENLDPVVAPRILAYLGLAPSQIVVCTGTSRRGKLIWLDALLAHHRPARVFLFTHPQNSAAIAACQPRPGRQYIFVHHVDRNPSLGAFMASAIHVDLTPFCFHCCRHRAGIAGNLFLPIVAPDLGCRSFAQPRADLHGLTTASSGAAYKFRLDHRPNYPEVVAAVLRLTGGRHIHIGGLPSRYLMRLHAALARQGVAPGRFLLVPSVPSLWRALGTYEVDLYIGSFPLRGARASVEVMGSGTPALWHVGDGASGFHDTHMKYPEAAIWRDIADLLGIIRGIDATWPSRGSRDLPLGTGAARPYRRRPLRRPAGAASGRLGRAACPALSGPAFLPRPSGGIGPCQA